MIISSISIKGGSGKSTAMINIATGFAKMGKKILLVDADQHSKSARRWCFRRDKLEKVAKVEWVIGEPGKTLGDELKKISQDYDYILVDLHGADSPENRDILFVSDALLIPFKPSQAEIDTFLDLKDLLTDLQKYRPETKTIAFLTEASTLTARDKKEARGFLEAKGIKLLSSVLHNRQSFKDCLATGMGVIEMANAKAAAEFNELFFEVIKSLSNDNDLQLSSINLQ